MQRKIKNDILFILIVLFTNIIRIIPRMISFLFADILLYLVYPLLKKDRHVCKDNLDLVYGSELTNLKKNKIIYSVFRNTVFNLIDTLLAEKIIASKKIFIVDGMDPVYDKCKLNGAILLTAHIGCFELTSHQVSKDGFDVSVLGVPLYDSRLEPYIKKIRTASGVKYISRNESFRPIIETLKKGNIFGILCDLDTNVDSRFVDFFNIPAKTPVAPFRLAIKLKKPMFVILDKRISKKQHLMKNYGEIIPVGESDDEKVLSAMKQYNDILEREIRKDPTQWTWMHKRWHSKP